MQDSTVRKEKLKAMIKGQLLNWGKCYERTLRQLYLNYNDQEWNAAVSELVAEGFCDKQVGVRTASILTRAVSNTTQSGAVQ